MRSPHFLAQAHTLIEHGDGCRQLSLGLQGTEQPASLQWLLAPTTAAHHRFLDCTSLLCAVICYRQPPQRRSSPLHHCKAPDTYSCCMHRTPTPAALLAVGLLAVGLLAYGFELLVASKRVHCAVCNIITSCWLLVGCLWVASKRVQCAT